MPHAECSSVQHTDPNVPRVLRVQGYRGYCTEATDGVLSVLCALGYCGVLTGYYEERAVLRVLSALQSTARYC